MLKLTRPFCIIVIFSFLICASGCATFNKNFGQFVPDNKARIAFETFQINPDYRYYYSGSDTYPVAMLALNKSYTMGNDLWPEVQVTPETMQQIILNMQNQRRMTSGGTHSGFAVLDHEGKQIGILYTYVGLGIALMVAKDNVVKIYGPKDDDQLRTYQGRTLGE
jgi:hypothetical protein